MIIIWATMFLSSQDIENNVDKGGRQFMTDDQNFNI